MKRYCHAVRNSHNYSDEFLGAFSRKLLDQVLSKGAPTALGRGDIATAFQLANNELVSFGRKPVLSSMTFRLHILDFVKKNPRLFRPSSTVHWGVLPGGLDAFLRTPQPVYYRAGTQLTHFTLPARFLGRLADQLNALLTLPPGLPVVVPQMSVHRAVSEASRGEAQLPLDYHLLGQFLQRFMQLRHNCGLTVGELHNSPQA